MRNSILQRRSSFWQRCVLQKALNAMKIPGIVLVFIFSYIPMYGILMSFQKYNPAVGIMGSEWVGLKYFKMLFENPFALRLIKNTLLLGLYSLLWNFPVPIILALLLDQVSQPKFKKAVQTISYFPHFLSGVVVIGLLK